MAALLRLVATPLFELVVLSGTATVEKCAAECLQRGDACSTFGWSSNDEECVLPSDLSPRVDQWSSWSNWAWYAQHPSPSTSPTHSPTPNRTAKPTPHPTLNPTPNPSLNPTPNPSLNPTPNPTPNRSLNPTRNPTPNPTPTPSMPIPTTSPSPSPGMQSSNTPTPGPNLPAGDQASPDGPSGVLIDQKSGSTSVVPSKNPERPASNYRNVNLTLSTDTKQGGTERSPSNKDNDNSADSKSSENRIDTVVIVLIVLGILLLACVVMLSVVAVMLLKRRAQTEVVDTTKNPPSFSESATHGLERLATSMAVPNTRAGHGLGAKVASATLRRDENPHSDPNLASDGVSISTAWTVRNSTGSVSSPMPTVLWVLVRQY